MSRPVFSYHASVLQAINGSAARCQTCFFPTYPYVDAIDLSAYKPMDFSKQWVYFLGDVTVRQMYGEFTATVHRSQVSNTATLESLSIMAEGGGGGCILIGGPYGCVLFGRGLHDVCSRGKEYQ